MLCPDPSLARLGARATARFTVLGELTIRAGSLPRQDADRLVTYVVIQALTEWSEFVRSLLLSSIAGATTKSGVPTSVGNPKIRNANDAIRLAVQLHSPHRIPKGHIARRQEPPWHDVKLLLRVCINAKVSNLSSMMAGVSTGSPVFNNLPPVRNFYAHRTLDSKARATKTLLASAVPSSRNPTDMLLSTQPGASQMLLRDWLDDLIASVSLMVV